MKYVEIRKLEAKNRDDRWWENLKVEKDDKWKILRHNGVLFPEEYKPLPKDVKLIYDGKKITLDSTNKDNRFNISAEEAVVFFATKMEQDDRLAEKDKKRKKSIDDSTFCKNFFNDLKEILGKGTTIKDFKKMDFSSIQRYISDRSSQKTEARRALSKEQKLEEKEKKEEIKTLYGYAIVDEIKIPLGNYMIQPPGLYIGHGAHPKRGMIKARVKPSDITLNISLDYVPKCRNNGSSCEWGDVVENKKVTWIASWIHPITEEQNYVWLKREESHWVCQDDKLKFEKARKLSQNIDSIRTVYTKDLDSKNKTKRQLATAVYLLDKLAIRPGTEKDETKEAGTLGLTTLKCTNIKFLGNDEVSINFVGKSSIEFSKKFKVESKVYRNLQSLCGEKKGEIFPDINANTLNEYLKTLMPDLSAKVFRTWKASSILQKLLDKNIPDIYDPTHEKKIVYNKVNIEVAKELNHKKMGTSDARIKKLKEKLKEFKEKKKDANTDAKKRSVNKSISEYKLKLEEAEMNISTATSKTNYIDPRIIVSWCKKAQLPIEKIYNKGQLKKFTWAMDVKKDWKF